MNIPNQAWLLKTRRKTIILAGLTSISVVLVVGFILPNDLENSIPCSLEFGIPEANALIAHQTIGEIYNQADVVVVGTITESYPCQKEKIVTRMTVDVEEYLKNPSAVDSIALESRGGEIPGIGGMWVEDEKIYDEGDRVLLFLYGPQNNIYKISSYSVLILDERWSGTELISGIELRAIDQLTILKKNETNNIPMYLDSFFEYSKETPVFLGSFSTYDSETDKFTLYEDPEELGEFGIYINSVMIKPSVDNTVSFDLPITIENDAIEGKYFLNLLALAQDQESQSIQTPWKIASKQIQIIVEKENEK